jgi:hypothetical protein
MMKIFNTKENIGTAKYVVNTHDGQAMHQDGSPFFGVSIFKNKVKLNSFISDLKKQGYKERSPWDKTKLELKVASKDTDTKGMIEYAVPVDFDQKQLEMYLMRNATDLEVRELKEKIAELSKDEILVAIRHW